MRSYPKAARKVGRRFYAGDILEGNWALIMTIHSLAQTYHCLPREIEEEGFEFIVEAQALAEYNKLKMEEINAGD